jgi:hypothetical protein
MNAKIISLSSATLNQITNISDDSGLYTGTTSVITVLYRLQELSPEQLGFDLGDEVPAEMSLEDEKDVSKVAFTVRKTKRDAGPKHV